MASYSITSVSTDYFCNIIFSCILWYQLELELLCKRFAIFFRLEKNVFFINFLTESPSYVSFSHSLRVLYIFFKLILGLSLIVASFCLQVLVLYAKKLNGGTALDSMWTYKCWSSSMTAPIYNILSLEIALLRTYSFGSLRYSLACKILFLSVSISLSPLYTICRNVYLIVHAKISFT